MRSMSCASTRSVTLKLTIPQIPHIHFSLISYYSLRAVALAFFNHNSVFPEMSLNIRNDLRRIEHCFAAIPERSSVYSHQSPKISVLRPQPEELSTHHAIHEIQIAIFNCNHNDVVIITNPHRRCDRLAGIRFEAARWGNVLTGNQERHHGYRCDSPDGRSQHRAWPALTVPLGRPALNRSL